MAASYPIPGVYIQESLNPLSDLPASPGSSTGAFVGVSSGGGPQGPVKISSWSQFQALYGGVGTNNDDLSYAVFLYFANGGTPCYIVRAINSDATSAALVCNDTEGSPLSTMTVTATAPGTWASSATSTSRVFVTITPSNPVGRFDLTIEVGFTGGTLVARESFVDLTMDPTDGRYALDIVNSPQVGSKYVTLTNNKTTYTANFNPAVQVKTPLTGGSEGTGTPDPSASLTLLDTIPENLVVNMPGATSSAASNGVVWAEASNRHFLVVDGVKPSSNESAASYATDLTSFAAAVSPASSFVAIYGPWVYISDPASKAGALRLTAPGGAVVGQYMYTDAFRGVQKVPAGTGTSLSQVVAPYSEFNDTQAATLYSASINIIKSIPGAGICIWGARTKKNGFPDRYVNIRRLLIAIEDNLKSLTHFAVFENNNEDLWATLDNVCTQYLQSLLTVRALKGDTYQQAFYVTCDATNNTPQTIGAGEVHVEVGVALENPAEFVIIRIGQTNSGTSTSDSLDIS